MVIHYTKNDCTLDQDDVGVSIPIVGYQSNISQMVLIDAGCEYHMYTSDITRTFPVSGAFTAPQRDLYQAVLNTQKECIKRCRVEDRVNLSELHRASESLQASKGARTKTDSSKVVGCCWRS